MALENARLQEKQLQQERRELKMELYREREMRESLERQLTSELRSRGKVLSCNTIIGKLKKQKSSNSIWCLHVELFSYLFLCSHHSETSEEGEEGKEEVTRGAGIWVQAERANRAGLTAGHLIRLSHTRWDTLTHTQWVSIRPIVFQQTLSAVAVC